MPPTRRACIGERETGTAPQPLRLAVVNDFAVVVAGVARLLEPFPDRVEVMEMDANRPVAERVDVALVDTFGQGESHTPDLQGVLDNPLATHVAVYTWQVSPELVARARARGFHGYLSKQLGAEELVVALEEVSREGMDMATSDDQSREARPAREWPGRDLGLSEREAEVLVLITRGLPNAEIADVLFLSENSIKTYIRSLYKKIGVESRTRAVLWGVDHGFRVDHRRLHDWRAVTDGESPEVRLSA